ncbi:PIG-L deacetylase family protein [Actinacidiphila epipremni]|jgi:4-oxalomesaconate hydratase|uniref:PIG-L family deacetylase n=1 Tax=Actinacidiphila epipremni TaxID=2053013 RepID=A0ABX0ZZI8_9ACTN|nr:PIG-L family deacetylase [Actinacidiphila epipremni]NJP47936.1 PIG-L family deacetylase [Actinacidiphila epipremni]
MTGTPPPGPAPRTVLIVSAHAADFVWRAGGAAALYAARGDAVHVRCLSFGERGESQGLWKQPGMDIGTVKEVRREEAARAAAALGESLDIDFYDAGDYPLVVTEQLQERLVQDMRALQPDVILTHAARDPYNLDHQLTHEFVLRCRMIAQAAGYPSAHPPIGAPQVLLFEPHQPEQCGFVPQLLLDITPVAETKLKAMQIMGAQGHLVDYYTDLARRRGVQYVRNGGDRGAVHAEAYQRVFPVTAKELV